MVNVVPEQVMMRRCLVRSTFNSQWHWYNDVAVLLILEFVVSHEDSAAYLIKIGKVIS